VRFSWNPSAATKLIANDTIAKTAIHNSDPAHGAGEAGTGMQPTSVVVLHSTLAGGDSGR
jgi:hypothetical protein